MKLTVKRRDPNSPALTAADLVISLDGREVQHLYSLQILLSGEDYNRAILEISIDDIEVDIDAIQELIARKNTR